MPSIQDMRPAGSPPEEPLIAPTTGTSGVRPDYPLGMKILLAASLFAVSLAYAQPADSGPPPESPPKAAAGMFCVMPTASAAKGAPSYPLGGLSAPVVGCHDDPAVIKKSKDKIRFKLFVSPDRKTRIDYVWDKPNEIQAACKNACIEQGELCKEAYAKGDKAKSSGCAAQQKACLNAQKPSTVEFQKGNCNKP